MKRVRVPELMDDPNLAPDALHKALDDLARANKMSGLTDMPYYVIQNHYRERGGKPLRVLDIGTGSGDIPIRLWHLAKRTKLNIQVSGCDISKTSIEYARERNDFESASVDFFEMNAVTDPFPQDYDVIMCSQFMHHLDPPDIVTVLRKMKEATRSLVVVIDLSRSYFNLALVWMATHFYSDSDVIHFDGPASVRASFTIGEWYDLTEQADIYDAEIKAKFPCRTLITWKRIPPL